MKYALGAAILALVAVRQRNVWNVTHLLHTPADGGPLALAHQQALSCDKSTASMCDAHIALVFGHIFMRCIAILWNVAARLAYARAAFLEAVFAVGVVYRLVGIAADITGERWCLVQAVQP